MNTTSLRPSPSRSATIGVLPQPFEAGENFHFSDTFHGAGGGTTQGALLPTLSPSFDSAIAAPLSASPYTRLPANSNVPEAVACTETLPPAATPATGAAARTLSTPCWNCASPFRSSKNV